jgi:hypothetical protein
VRVLKIHGEFVQLAGSWGRGETEVSSKINDTLLNVINNNKIISLRLVKSLSYPMRE